MTKHDFTFRRAGPDDAETIHAGLLMLAQAVDLDGKVMSSPEDIRQAMAQPDPAFVALLAEDDGHFAGLSLFFRSYSTWRGVPGIYLQDFVVAPAWRGTGLARQLMAATAQTGAALWQARYLRLSVDTDNAAARRFYDKAGLPARSNEIIHAAYDADFDKLASQHVTIGRQNA